MQNTVKNNINYIKNKLNAYSKEEIGKTLKYFRNYKKVSQNHLAKQLGGSFQIIQKYENGK